MSGARPTLLITGAAGRVGRAVRPYLRERYQLRLIDIAPLETAPGEAALTGDMNDPTILQAGLRGVCGVLHLACVHGFDLTFEASLDVNYRALLAVLQQSVAAGVERFVYTSSLHVVGQHPLTGFAGDNAALSPDAFYGLSKVFGEAACALYTRRSELRTLIIRMGNADPEVGDERRLRQWTSARDLANLIHLGLTHPNIKLETVYGVSNCPAPLFANRRARELGYVPLDHAHLHLASDYQPYEQMSEGLRDFVGGYYAAGPLPNVRETAPSESTSEPLQEARPGR